MEWINIYSIWQTLPKHLCIQSYKQNLLVKCIYVIHAFGIVGLFSAFVHTERHSKIVKDLSALNDGFTFFEHVHLPDLKSKTNMLENKTKMQHKPLFWNLQFFMLCITSIYMKMPLLTRTITFIYLIYKLWIIYWKWCTCTGDGPKCLYYNYVIALQSTFYVFTLFGSTPNFLAMSVMMCSLTSVPCGPPNPRIAVLDGVLVLHILPTVRKCGMLYGIDIAIIETIITFEGREKERDLTQSCNKSYTHRKFHKATWQHKNATETFDYTTMADQLRTVSWSHNNHPTGVVKPNYGIPTFPLTTKAV